jgi:hypothetical protein
VQNNRHMAAQVISLSWLEGVRCGLQACKEQDVLSTDGGMCRTVQQHQDKQNETDRDSTNHDLATSFDFT